MAARKHPATAIPAIDERTRRGVMLGGRFVLVCAAGISFPNLYALALIAALPWYLAPLLPLSIDAYAYIAMWFADQVPQGHPARASALRNGALALAMSVACNVLDRFLTLAGAMVQPWARDVLLSAVFALPPFIVGRVLHLRALADGTGASAPTAASTEPAAPRPVPAPASNPSRPQPVAPVAPDAPATESPVAPRALAIAPRPQDAPSAPTRLIPQGEHSDIILGLLAEHGRDNVTGPMVAQALGGLHRANGLRQLNKVLEAVDAGVLAIPGTRETETPAEDPARELVPA